MRVDATVTVKKPGGQEGLFAIEVEFMHNDSLHRVGFVTGQMGSEGAVGDVLPMSLPRSFLASLVEGEIQKATLVAGQRGRRDTGGAMKHDSKVGETVVIRGDGWQARGYVTADHWYEPRINTTTTEEYLRGQESSLPGLPECDLEIKLTRLPEPVAPNGSREAGSQ
jgi:hypothetical protein